MKTVLPTRSLQPSKLMAVLHALTSVHKLAFLAKGNRKNGVGSSPVQVLIGGNSPNLDHGKINGSNLFKNSSHEKYISSSEESLSISESLIAVLDSSDFNYLLQ